MSSLRRDETRTAYLFLLPNILGFLIFTALAVVASAGIALTDWDLLSPPEFVGFKNFVRLLTRDETFVTVLRNTLVFTAASVVATMALSLLVALAMNQALRGIVVFRTAYYLPVVTSSVAVAVVWTWFYNPDFGPLNYYLGRLGVRAPAWLGSPEWALPAVIIVAVWKTIGYDMILWLAGLQGIPPHLYEAAVKTSVLRRTVRKVSSRVTRRTKFFRPTNSGGESRSQSVSAIPADATTASAVKIRKPRMFGRRKR